MSKKLHFIAVRGRQHEWTFRFYADSAHLEEWRADGLEVYAIENSVPAWVADLGLARPWCFLQSLFHFRRPGR